MFFTCCWNFICSWNVRLWVKIGNVRPALCKNIRFASKNFVFKWSVADEKGKIRAKYLSNLFFQFMLILSPTQSLNKLFILTTWLRIERCNFLMSNWSLIKYNWDSIKENNGFMSWTIFIGCPHPENTKIKFFTWSGSNIVNRCVRLVNYCKKLLKLRWKSWIIYI